jgi:hypothetical protein
LGVAFADHFPATAWVWRKLTSRWARRLFLSLMVLLLLLTTALRIWAFTFEYRVNSIVAGLAQLQLDQTTRAEMLARVPALHPDSQEEKNCAAEECYVAEITNQFTGLIYKLLVEDSNESTYKVNYWLGLRYWSFAANVELRQGKVYGLRYSLILDDGTYLYPGGLRVRANSVRGDRGWFLSAVADESPDYRVTQYFRWPEQDLRVEFTPRAPVGFARHAFEVQLECLWQFWGCKTAKQVLPAAWNDKQAFEAAARARLRSDNPCLDRVLQQRARTLSDIFLLEVEQLHPDAKSDDEWKRVIVDYKLLEILKGEVRGPLNGLGSYLEESIPGSRERIPNFDLTALKPGAKVLMFSDRERAVDSPCEIVAATPSVLRTIRTALASPASEVADEPLPNR